MGKIEKKITKLKARIAEMEEEMFTELKQKNSHSAEISIGMFQRRIEEMRKELSLLEKIVP